MTRSVPILVLLVALAGITLSTCVDVPIRNVPETQLAIRSDYVTLDQVSDAIVRAGTNLGWSMYEEVPGHIVGTLTVRDHQAVVDIFYNTETFSIGYKDSANLLYTGSTIHRNYNRWVMNLERAIQNEVVSL